jgi:hypothetical protein
VSFNRSWLPLSETPYVHLPKMDCVARICIQSFPLWTVVGTWKILNHNVEPRVFTFLWNRYHQLVTVIELIDISAFFLASYSKIIPVFHCWKAKQGWNLTINLQTPKIDYCCIYGLYGQTWRIGFSRCWLVCQFIFALSTLPLFLWCTH